MTKDIVWGFLEGSKQYVVDLKLNLECLEDYIVVSIDGLNKVIVAGLGNLNENIVTLSDESLLDNVDPRSRFSIYDALELCTC